MKRAPIGRFGARVLIRFLLLSTILPIAVPVQAEDALADAYRIITGKRFVDLTHSFGPESPVWQGFGQATMSTASDPQTQQPYTIEKNGFRTTFYSMVGQYGTHIDPPAHFDAKGITMDKIPIKEMILKLVVFDITPLLVNHPNHALTVHDIHEWEKKNGKVPKGAFAALRTDMYKDWSRDPQRFKRYPFPAWSIEAIKFLFEQRGITAIGHEALDTDIKPNLESEKWLLTNKHWQIEAMAYLDEVPPAGSIIVVTWPKVKNGFGFPARAFAILP